MQTYQKLLLLFFFFIFSNLTTSELSGSPSLRISPNNFVDSAKEVTNILQQLHSILSPFNNNTSGDGISVCLHLLDMSSEELRMSISAVQNPKGKDKLGTGNLSSDLRTWLSSVLTNSYTCIEGLDEEGLEEVKGIASKELDRVMYLVKTLLHQVIPVHYDQVVNKDQFPSWISEEDKMLLSGNIIMRTPDAVVAIDGSGNYHNLTAAIRDAPDFSMKRYVIYVKRGVYRDEYVTIAREKWNIMLTGDGIGATVISGSRSYGDGYSTFQSATFAVEAVGFISRDISFENTAGPMKGMAVALRSDSDLSIFHRCGIFGYQDSLYPRHMRQFYKDCTIGGTIDFIFGDAQAVFQNCQIIVKQGMPKQNTNTITAQGREDPGQPTGFSFQFCNISADPNLKPTTQTYLGRPWRNFSRTVFMESYLSSVIDREGWLEWKGNALDTLTYGEYQNHGPGAKIDNRVKWSGYRVLNRSEAEEYTVDKFIQGNLWLPANGLNYTSGL